jgi:hypothetical protein
MNAYCTVIHNGIHLQRQDLQCFLHKRASPVVTKHSSLSREVVSIMPMHTFFSTSYAKCSVQSTGNINTILKQNIYPVHNGTLKIT